jgi:hypothetical protein
LPDGALMHDPNAYLRSQGETPPKLRANPRQPQAAAAE